MRHKVYTTFGSIFDKKVRILFIIFLALITNSARAQESFDLFGFSSNNGNKSFRLNTMESNTTNYSQIKDMEISLIYGSESYQSTTFNSVFLISLAKKIYNSSFYIRYTPGYIAEFPFNSGTSVVLSESSVDMNTYLTYKELIGLGYSYKLTDKLFLGTSFRYFTQEFVDDNIDSFISLDSVSYIEVNSQSSSANYWRGDFGITYTPYKNLNISISSANLILIDEENYQVTDFDYRMNRKKSAILGVQYSPTKNISLSGTIESNDSYTAGVSGSLPLFKGNLSLSIGTFYDNNQQNGFGGIFPSLSYSFGQINVTASWIKYFNNNNTSNSISEFQENKISSVLNNQYSGDRILAGFNLALSFTKEQKVKFIDVVINSEIYPTLYEKYSDFPFAIAQVENISDEVVEIKPASYIERLNRDLVYSPSVFISPGEIKEVPFYTVVEFDDFDKQQIANADFYISSGKNESDDIINKPILINDKNSWDGDLTQLHYFMIKENNFCAEYSKNILSEYKDSLNNIASDKKTFEQTKILFNSFSKNMSYVSDPRSRTEFVQFPSETIMLKGGDCDDLSLCFASLLQGIGIQTAFVDYKSSDKISHVNILVNTKLKPTDSNLITINDKKYFVRENIDGNDEIWIPIETTSLTDFNKAWSVGSEKFYKEAILKLGLIKGKVEIIDIN